MSVKSLAETVPVCVSGIEGEDEGGSCRRQELGNQGDEVGERKKCGRISEGGNAYE